MTTTVIEEKKVTLHGWNATIRDGKLSKLDDFGHTASGTKAHIEKYREFLAEVEAQMGE